ncbi:peptidase E [Bacillus marinisedimentorum]|uniref:Type 1 glutamine amidotransferase-like domain-containing protein n=1 Tax=Bacillus marinisedimentorum TaxID=1821260 RepID=UPI0008729DFF|nr:peptidase E [Bacillus marinisedimentorum]
MKQIIAMGGGGFSMEPDNPLLDQYVLEQSPAQKPKVCFLPTASGDAESYINRFYDAFKKLECEPSHLSLFKPHTRDLEGFLLSKDIIYVGGGNTINMLVLWKEWGVDRILKRAWEKGIVLTGLSAGSICWFEEGVTDSFGDELEPMEALGFLPGSHCPHYDGEEYRRPVFGNLIAEGRMRPGYAADDCAALHFIGTDPVKSVSSRPDAKVYYVRKNEGSAEHRELEMDYLGE